MVWTFQVSGKLRKKRERERLFHFNQRKKGCKECGYREKNTLRKVKRLIRNLREGQTKTLCISWNVNELIQTNSPFPLDVSKLSARDRKSVV